MRCTYDSWFPDQVTSGGQQSAPSVYSYHHPIPRLLFSRKTKPETNMIKAERADKSAPRGPGTGRYPLTHSGLRVHSASCHSEAGTNTSTGLLGRLLCVWQMPSDLSLYEWTPNTTTSPTHTPLYNKESETVSTHGPSE